MGTEADDAALTDLRISVARMEGMLSQALSDHGQRITNLESDNRTLHGRLSDKSKEVGRHDERIKDLEESNTSRRTFAFALVGAIVACAGLVLAILNRITIQ